MQTGTKRTESNEHERQLLKRVVDEDRLSFESLYLSYHPRLFRFIYRLTGSHTVTDELVNDIMLLVWRQAASFRGDSKVSTWIFGIAYRQTMRRLSRTRSVATSQKEVIDASIDGRSDNEDWVRKGLKVLPLEQRVTTELVFFLGLSYREVAEVTNCPVSTVKTRMFHARRKLKDILSEIASPANSDTQEFS
jgi:RNA polymerase sigma-70 factor (ECF subfamily)